jgi:hypothetical protein
VPLDEAALAIAEEEYPRLDPDGYLVRLDVLAARVRRRAPAPGRSPRPLPGAQRGRDLDRRHSRRPLVN